MLIRSQDKRAITDDMKLYVRENDFVRGKVTWDILNSTQDRLAKYSTEEKAIKVLDMIQDAYARCESVKVLSSGIMFEVTERIRNQEKAEDFKNEHRATFVFQMPQDSEV